MIIHILSNGTDWIKDIIPSILGAIIGGLLTLLGSYKATQMAHKNNLNILEKKNKEIENAVILSIGEELKGLFEIYNNEFMELFKSLESEHFLTTCYKITLDPFVIYKANADKIGNISNEELRNMIIKIYTFLRKFVEQLKIYDTCLNNLYSKRISVLNSIDKKRFDALILANLDTQNIINLLQDYISKNYKNNKKISNDYVSKINHFLQTDKAEMNDLNFQSIELKNLYEKIVSLNDKIQSNISALDLR